MKLWLISQDENDGYETFDSAVVAAETEEEARNVNPDGKWKTRGAWADNPENVTADYLGEAAKGIKSGYIACSSFNAA